MLKTLFTHSGGGSLGDRPQTSMTPAALISSRAFLRLQKHQIALFVNFVTEGIIEGLRGKRA